MDGPFDSAWLKWAQAVVNANVLADNVNAFARQANVQVPILIRSDYDAKRHCIVLTVEEIGADLFPRHWGLLLGDVVHNFRSALDHVAWALYKRGRTPNLSGYAERDIYFPIYDDRIKFNKSLKRKLPGVSRADIAKVRRCQPYLKSKRNHERHVLRVVDELSRLDKHRTVQPVIPVPDSTGYHIRKQTDCIYRRMSPRSSRGMLQPGAELTRLYVKKTGPNPHIDVQPGFTIDPAINARLPLKEFLITTIRATSLVLLQFAEPPADAEKIAGRPVPRP